MQGDAGSGDAKILVEVRLSAGITKKYQFTASVLLGLERLRYAPFIGGVRRSGVASEAEREACCGRGVRQD